MEPSEKGTPVPEHVSRIGPMGALILLCFLAGLVVVSWVTEHGRKVESRHEDFVRVRPPWHGRAWDKKEAVLYRDVDHPLTWHVCTEDSCGVYMEAGEVQR